MSTKTMCCANRIDDFQTTIAEFNYIHTFGGKFATYSFLIGIPSSVWVGIVLSLKGDTFRFAFKASESNATVFMLIYANKHYKNVGKYVQSSRRTT